MEERVNFSTELNGNKYEGAQGEVYSDPLIDSATGKALVLRTFEYKINPEIKYTPTKQELFNYHWPQIKTFLWKDGFTASEQVDPRIVVSDKSYRIHILCEPKSNTIVNEKPLTLQELLPTK